MAENRAEGKVTFNTARNILAIKFYGTEEGKEINRILNQVDENPWHTGTPTEEGWYLLHYPKSKEQPYELAQYDGEHFMAVKPFHSIIVRINVDTVPYWQRIEPYMEENNG